MGDNNSCNFLFISKYKNTGWQTKFTYTNKQQKWTPEVNQMSKCQQLSVRIT